MTIIIDGIKTKVTVQDYFMEKNGFLETLYEWLDSNDIDIEFNKEEKK